jgi:hypothetical protein
MSLIPYPSSANYRFQSIGYNVITKPGEISKGLTPDSNIVKRSVNFNYQTLSDNLYAYVAIYIADLDDFVNATFDKLTNIEIVAHDQIRLNFEVNLVTPSGNLLTPKEIFSNPEYANKYSRQYGEKGIQLKEYETFIINAITQVINSWPVDMRKIDEFHPEYKIGEFFFISLNGEITKKAATYGAVRYRDENKKQKVLFWGAGLKENKVQA